ncbi:Crp/Fnr family transcriptional regulator [Rhodocytophaga rosea]|uniref:Crp/Fnr family transcriptional regulator n=1 Tax=Rhodocytophaga rosea TaxID=2704465 RepID=A0A6C0GV76_9BACT|nr:Crp/Fnr family transcriptional regulator [Rhodocytophaga rosea]
MTHDIVSTIGQFSATEIALFEKHTTRETFNKNDILLNEGEICQSVYFVESGCFFQFQLNEITETIIDLHLPKEWVFNHQSIIAQSLSKTVIKAFSRSEVVKLSLSSLHHLIATSQAFLQFGRIFNQVNDRTYLFDNSLNPAQKYAYIQEAKPQIAQLFPIKMIASYLKMAPETLSRIRANY